jgi:hypothetical protein
MLNPSIGPAELVRLQLPAGEPRCVPLQFCPQRDGCARFFGQRSAPADDFSGPLSQRRGCLFFVDVRHPSLTPAAQLTEAAA